MPGSKWTGRYPPYARRGGKATSDYHEPQGEKMYKAFSSPIWGSAYAHSNTNVSPCHLARLQRDRSLVANCNWVTTFSIGAIISNWHCNSIVILPRQIAHPIKRGLPQDQNPKGQEEPGHTPAFLADFKGFRLVRITWIQSLRCSCTSTVGPSGIGFLCLC